jgi:hypothetical protein
MRTTKREYRGGMLIYLAENNRLIVILRPFILWKGADLNV